MLHQAVLVHTGHVEDSINHRETEQHGFILLKRDGKKHWQAFDIQPCAA
jgi:hypothetical protein